MRVNALASSPVSGSSHASRGHAAGRRNDLQAGYNDRLSALRSDFHEARRAAAGDPAKLAEVQAQFKEQKAALKTEAENLRAQFRSRVDDRFGDDDDSTEPAVTTEPLVAAAPEVESETTLDVMA